MYIFSQSKDAVGCFYFFAPLISLYYFKKMYMHRQNYTYCAIDVSEQKTAFRIAPESRCKK